MTWTEEDSGFYRKLTRADGGSASLMQGGYRDQGPVVAVFCGDGSREVEDAVWRAALNPRRFHRLAWNGGALPLHRDHEALAGGEEWHRSREWHLAFQYQLWQAVQFKRPATVLLVLHWPCGAANAARMSLRLAVDRLRALAMILPREQQTRPFGLDTGVRTAFLPVLVAHEVVAGDRVWLLKNPLADLGPSSPTSPPVPA